MIAIRLAIPTALAAAFVVCAICSACFPGPLFGGGASYHYNGVDPNTPIPDMTPNENASTASGLMGGRRTLDAGNDSAPVRLQSGTDAGR